MLTKEQAVRKIKRDAQAENEPRVSPEDIADILDENVRAAVRINATAYRFGDKVVLSPSNGRLYKCIQAGTSGTSAPTTGQTSMGIRLEDGTAVFEDAGPACSELWDIRGAIGAVWELKASKDSALIDMSDKDTKMELTKRRDFAKRQAQLNKRTFVV